MYIYKYNQSPHICVSVITHMVYIKMNLLIVFYLKWLTLFPLGPRIPRFHSPNFEPQMHVVKLYLFHLVLTIVIFICFSFQLDFNSKSILLEYKFAYSNFKYFLEVDPGNTKIYMINKVSALILFTLSRIINSDAYKLIK